MNHHDDDDQPATAETIIHALSQIGADVRPQQQGRGSDASDSLHHYSTLLSNDNQLNEDDSGQHDLEGMSRRDLEAEVLKLRGLVSQGSNSPSVQVQGDVRDQRDPANGPIKRVKTAKGRQMAVKVNVQTGKRVEKDRKTELYKAIRHTMRQTMGMLNEADPLPVPGLAQSSTADDTPWTVPDWGAPIGDEANQRWINTIAQNILDQLRSDPNPYPKVEDHDSDLSTIQEAVKVTFANYIKRYKSENDTKYADRKARYAKNQRRWARKDLKQEKRSKVRTNMDPSSPFSSLPNEALLFDYQSSEYSSSGSDSADSDEEYHSSKVQRRKVEWDTIRNPEAGPGSLGPRVPASADHVGNVGKAYGWGTGLKAKVLEVRTPSWRSEQLNEYYAHLDSLSQSRSQARSHNKAQSNHPQTTSTKAGHVAPSHRRFSLPTEVRRKGTVPRALKGGSKKRRKAGDVVAVRGTDAGELSMKEGGLGELGWMWATGKVGVWPTRHMMDGSREQDVQSSTI